LSLSIFPAPYSPGGDAVALSSVLEVPLPRDVLPPAWSNMSPARLGVEVSTGLRTPPAAGWMGEYL